MRIGLLRLRYSDRKIGGAERSLNLLITGLQSRKHDVHIIVSSWEGIKPLGINLHLVPVQGKGINRLKDYATKVISKIQLLKLDTCISLERVPGISIFRAGDGCHAAWLKRRANYESIFKRISFKFNPLHRGYLELERRMFNSPNLTRVIANSQLVANELKFYYGLSDNKIKIIYNGVDEQRLRQACIAQIRQHTQISFGIKQGEPILLFLGSGFERKGLAFALAALTNLPKIKLLVVGGGRIDTYQRLARQLGITNRVVFLGQRYDAYRLLAVASALVLPTIYDPCSNACLESLFIGTPVVTTCANGASEFIKDGINGVLITEPSDSTALANACYKAISLVHPVPNMVRINSQFEWINDVESELLKLVADTIL